MIGVEFDTGEHAEEVQWEAFQRGLLVLECGTPSVRMSPALTVSPAEMETGLRIFAESVALVAGRARPDPRGRQRRPVRCTRWRPPADPGDRPMTTSKVASMRDAIADLVRDGDTVAIEGFTHLISFAAGHEIIRQRKRDLTLARLTPGRHLRPDGRGRRRPQAGLLVARQPGRRRARRDPAADRGARSRTSRSRSRSTATSGWSGATRPAR